MRISVEFFERTEEQRKELSEGRQRTGHVTPVDNSSTMNSMTKTRKLFVIHEIILYIAIIIILISFFSLKQLFIIKYF